jgi:hypothetical protein
MPYNSQGIARSEACLRVELSYLFNNKYIEKDRIKECVMTWNRGKQEISFAKLKTVFNESEKYINLSYNKTDNITGENKSFDYRINLVSIQSNLGKGRIYYFECPFNKRKCRVLYMTYGSPIFKSRFAYSKRIYYNIQTVSKREYPLTRTLKLQKEINRLKESRMKHTYKGRLTKTFKRYGRLVNHYDKFETLNLSLLMQALSKFKN